MTVPARPASVAVIGGGPAGLMAAERLGAAGLQVTIYERMPSVGRKFLLAGRGGLNLTHSEPLPAFLARYRAAESFLAPAIHRFPPQALRAWAEELGQPTFVGSSGRVFPQAFKASPLLRAWLARLASYGVAIRIRRDWQGWDEAGRLYFAAPGGAETAMPDATILALGGASWPRLGADGSWVPLLAGRGVAVTPLAPANSGFRVAWTEPFRSRFAGQPIKTAAFTAAGRTVRGEAVVTRTGIEGGAIYALSGPLRDALAEAGAATLTIDLRPDMSAENIAGRLRKARPGQSRSNLLRKAAGLPPVAINLLREAQDALPAEPDALAAAIKAVHIPLLGPEPIERAISTAGGLSRDAVDETLMLKAMPGVFAAGEMLDWEAPTGGYLLQACFATGLAAAEGVLGWLGTGAPLRPG